VITEITNSHRFLCYTEEVNDRGIDKNGGDKYMGNSKRLLNGALLGVTALALGACASGGVGSGVSGSIEDSAKSFDSINEGEIDLAYNIDSYRYGKFNVSLTGKYEETSKEATEDSSDESKESSESSESNESSEDKESNESNESNESSEDKESNEEKDTSSRAYDYSLVEGTVVLVDGKETKSTGEITAIGDTLYDRVYLTGSGADGKFVYDTRDGEDGAVDYPLADYLSVSPIINAFDFADIEVTTGKLADTGKTGHTFTVTPEEVVTALQEGGVSSELGNNILGIVSEENAEKVNIGVNKDTFTVEVYGTDTETSEPTSESTSESSSESTSTTEDGQVLVGRLVITKKAGDVEITKPTNSIDLEEFSSLVEKYYQDMTEAGLEGAEDTTGSDTEADVSAESSDAETSEDALSSVELTEEEASKLEAGEITAEELLQQKAEESSEESE